MEIDKSYFLRKIDELGRVVIPIEIREALEIKEADTLKIHIENGNIIIENKYVIQMIYFFIDSARIIIAERRIVVEEILTIIVADDNAYMSDFMSKIIKEDSRFKFIGFAKDEKEEIELINSLKPNVVITDLKKGNKWTGIDIIKEVQDNNEIAPIFFVTSASIYYYYDKLKELKIRYFLNKPFDIEQVKEVLNRIYDDVFPKQIVELTENKKIETNNNIFLIS